MSDVLDAVSLTIAARLPVLLWGPPGSGKSSVLVALAEGLGLPCEVVVASIREPTDFAGLPVITPHGVEFAPPRWAKRLAEAGRGVLFLDEITTAAPAVQAALLRVVLDHAVGDLDLPPDVHIVAAANPAEQAADGWELTLPLANRFVHYQWNPDAMEVGAGLLFGFDPPHVVQPPVDWEVDHLRPAALVVAGFLGFRPELVSKLPSPDARALGFPTPRSWEMALRLWAISEAAAASEHVRYLMLSGAIGPGAASELMAYAREVDLQMPAWLLDHPDGFVHPARTDLLFALLSAVVAAALQRGGEEAWTAAWRVLARAAHATPDVAAYAARVLAKHQPAGAALPPEARVFVSFLRPAATTPTLL